MSKYAKISCNIGEENVIENYELTGSSGQLLKNANMLIKKLNKEKDVMYTLVEICDE